MSRESNVESSQTTATPLPRLPRPGALAGFTAGLDSITTASKKRKIVTGQTADRGDDAHTARQSPPHETSSPQPSAATRSSASPPPPRYLPPHLHDEVLTDSEPLGASSRDHGSPTGASSPSEAYANLTLEGSMLDEGPDSQTPQQPQQPPQRQAPRSSSPAKRPHSDMADDGMDIDSQAAQRNKPLSTRATSVEMADAPNSGSSETDTSNTDSAATSIDAAQQADLPSLDEQVTTVMGMMQAPLKERQEGYIISERWLERVWARTSENSGRPQEFSKEATQGPIGPVDNAGLVDTDAMQDDLVDQRGEDFIPLSKATQMGQDFEILPTKAWELVISWYGLKEGTPVIRRYAQNTVPDKSSEYLQYELHPPVFTIRKVHKAPPTTAESKRPAGKLVASCYESYLSFLEAAKKTAGIDLKNKVRVWRILDAASTDVPQEKKTQPSGILTPDASPSPRNGSPVASTTSPVNLIMDAASFNGLTYGTEREMVTGKDEKANEDFNQDLSLAGAGLSQDMVVVLEEHDDKGEYISDASKAISKNKTGAQGNKGLQSKPSSGRSTPTGGATTRGRMMKNGRVRGYVGLTNLGNTCYMNSALQCLRSVQELSMFFLSKKWTADINANNPIGHGGQIAKSYAGVLNGIYNSDGSTTFSPKGFKNMLGKANSLFSGYGQQDSQEFVSWLVDALHEDLNRVQNKPYSENPDSTDDTFRDPEAIKELGQIYRKNHAARNDSVAMDLFSGFYKNTMVCPTCEKVSITFDPYSQLTLQLPIEQTWQHTITYIPLHGKPFQLPVDIDKNATIKGLKEYVGKRGGNVPADRIMASEVYNHKFYRHLDDKKSIAESNITQRDDIFLYELDHTPTNWPPPKKKKGSQFKSIYSQGSSDDDIPDSASPLHDRIIVPVFHRGPSMSSYKSQNFSMALWPFFLVLTREEAKDNDTILRKLLAKVAQMTTRPILSELGDSSSQSRSGSDVVLTTEEDASPNGDPRVTDGSVEGEDLVEVTMTDREQTTDAEELPEVLRPGSFIQPEFRTLFEIKHTKRSQEMVTTGWSSVDHSRALEPISKRIRIPPSPEGSTHSSLDGSEGSSSDEDADTPDTLGADIIEAANVTSDEDMPNVAPEGPSNARSGRKGKKQRKKQRKQERKHMNNKNYKKKNRVPDQPNYPDDPEDENDDSLVRMGEALVLEWEPNSYEALFGGTSATDSRGMETSKYFETLEDAEIIEKNERRKARSKHGITLDECFTETSKSEILSEDNAWYCSRCKELRRATKTLEIWTVPDILIIHLKRFSGHRSFRDKIEELIDFPVKGLDLSGKVGFPEDKDQTYDLFAVDNHYGGLGGGHYTATAQNFFDGQWYDYNDSSVSKTTGDRAVTRSAYLLFYRRRTPSPLGPPELQTIVTNAEAANETAPPSEDEDEAGPGNGLRPGVSSRNGSGPGAAHRAPLDGGSNSQLLGPASQARSAAGAVSDEDEGFVDAEDAPAYSGPHAYGFDDPMWSFEGMGTMGRRVESEDGDDGGSDRVELGDDLRERLEEDFGGEGVGGLVMGDEGEEEDGVVDIRIGDGGME